MGFVIRWLRAFALFSFLSFTLSTQVFAFNVAQTTFVPLSEPNIDTSIKAIRSTGASNSVQTIISISATSNNTIIVYDQWEDGYESNLSNPVQTSTGVWGDGNTANGTAPGTTDDLIHAGDTITLRNVVNTASPATVDYDGSDKIGSTKAISVTQAGWDTGIGTIVAGAVNVIDAGNGGKNFILPIGENIGNLASNNATLFEYTSIHIIAYAANTNISIDKDGDGTTDQTLVLSEGQTARVDSGVINAGATVSSDKPIGVYLIAGDIGQSENRWFGLNSLDQWATSYYAPVATVGSGHPSHVFLRNPNASAITVYYDTKSSIGNTLTVNANATNAIQVPTSAVHFYTTDGSKFYAVGTIDSGASKHFYYDWSYSLVPESYLTDRFIVAWGPGSSNTPPAENGSPVWITSIADTWLYIDNSSTVNVRDSSGTAVTREVVDADTSRYRIHALESYRLYDTDYDQSGLIAYTLDGTLITAAWGEDPSTAGLTDPYLDMGTTVLPYPDYVFKKVSAEASPVLYAGASDGDLLSELNEEIEYTITIANRSVVELYNVNIKDALNPSDSATYVPSSATLTVLDADNNVKVNITDLDGASDTFPLSDPGYTLTDADSATGGDQGLARGHKIVVKYRMKIRGDINTALADDNYVINNTATMAGSPPVGDPIDPKDTNNTTIISVIDAADQSVVENVSILDANFTISNLTGLTQITVNGTDVSAAQLNASATTPVSIPTPQGTLTIKGFDSTTGVVTYDYDPAGTSKDHSGGSVTDPITLVASYSASVTVENMLNITILDTAPVANSDTNSIDENDANASGNVITGPTTADTLVGDSVSMTGIGAGTLPGVDGNVSSTVVGTYGSIIMQNNGDYVYLLDNANPSVNGLKNGEILSDIFTYTITDSDGNTSTTQLVVTINGVNDAPVAIDDNATTDLDTPVTIPVRNNDSDIEGDDLNVTVVSNGTNGTVSIDPISGDPVYTPNPGWTGIDTFTYTISDGNGTATATVTITVTSYPIDAVDDDYSSTPINGADGNSTASVLNNDTLNGTPVNPSDITLTPGSAPVPGAGSITMNPDGTITVAAGTTAGTYSYPYQICENLNPSNCDEANATVVVAAAPIDAVDDDYSSTPINGADGNSTASVLNNDTLNGTPVNPSDITLTPGSAPVPGAGSITMNPDGTITVAAGTTAGTYSYPYQICENLNPSNCDEVNATVVVAPPTISVSDENETEGTALVFDVNLSNPSSEAITFTPGLVDATASTSLDLNLTAVTYSVNGGMTWVPYAGGDITIPAGVTNVMISIPSVDDTIHEGTENFTATATVTSSNTSNANAQGTGTIIDNDPVPTISVSDENETEGTALVFDVNLSNPSSEAITFTPGLVDATASTSLDLNLTAVTYSVNGGMTWVPYAGGDITIPAGVTNVMISIPSVDDTIHEGTENFTVTATVTSSNTSNANAQGTGTIIDNDPVPSVSIADQTVTEGDTLVFTVMLSNPTYEDINLTIETADGTATTANNDYTPQTVTVLIPAGSISVTVSVPTTDDGVVENDENMTIAPTQVNSGTVDQMSGATGWILNDDVGPTATDDTVNGIAGQETVIHVVNNDSSGTSALDPTSVRIIDPNTGDMVTELVVPGEGRWVVDPVTGDITFEAEEGFTGDPAPIEYSVQDTAGNEDQAMITVDYPPVARDDNATGKLNEIITVNVLANDSNTSKPLDPLSVVITDENGTVIGSGKELIVPNEGIWTVNDDGTITFTPEENFPGCATPIHYTVSEENSIGPIDTSNPATVTVCYPPALDDVLNTQDQPGTAQTVNVLDNDAECIDPATVQIVDPDTNSLTDILVVAGEGTWTVDPSIGSITFTPQAGFEYDPTPIEYQAICENGQETKRATVTINYPLFARDDEKLDNDYGTPVILNDSLNDNGDLNTSSVELHLPDGFMDQHPDAVLSDDKKSLVVPGQGEWIVNDDGTITFVPEVGFEDDPTPIEYSVKNYSGAESNYAKLRVTYCDSPQKSDGGDAMGTISLLLMMMMTALIGLNFIRREESRGEK